MIRDPKRFAMTLSVSVSIIMLVGKLTAYFLTASKAILADAAESVVHGGATALAAFALWYAAKPADESHPYGHGRISYFSAGFEGALVLCAAIAVIYSGIAGLIHHQPLTNLGVGLAIASGLALINLFVGGLLVHVGKTHHSLILVANGKHVLSDMWTTVASIVGVGLVMLTGRWWVDPMTAILMGLYVGWTGFSLLKAAYTGLMDQVPARVRDTLVAALNDGVTAALITSYHQLRCRTMDHEVWVDVHMLVPSELSISKAHEQVTAVEQLIRERFPDDRVYVTSHIEPSDHDAAHPEGHGDVDDPLTPKGHTIASRNR